MAKFFVFHRNGRSDFQLADHNVVGRHPKNRIKVLEPGVSKVHCLISQEGDGAFTIRDLGSRNGTYVNGDRVEEAVALSDGDEILLGTTRCLFREEMAASAVVRMVSDPDAVGRIRLKISPLRLNKFFPEANVIDEEMLRADYERLRIAFELSQDIGFDLHVDFILSRVLDRASEVLDFDLGVVFLAGEEGTLRAQSYKRKALEGQVSLPRELLDHVVQEQKGILAAKTLDDGRSGPGSGGDRKAESFMAVPMLYEKAFLGIVAVQKIVAGQGFGEKHLRLLSNVANKTATFIRNSQIAKRVTRESLERERFRKIVSPEMAERIVAGQLPVPLAGEAREATVVVAAIRDDSALREFDTPEVVVEALNAYFEAMVDVVFRLEGMVAHFLGDRLVAAWGVPLKHRDDPLRAVQAALEMARRSADSRRGPAPGRVGIGIDTGTVVAGSVGAGWTARYSVYGDIVNSASALAGSADPGQVVASENTFFNIRRRFATRPLDGIAYRDGRLTRYEVVADRSEKPGVPWTHLG